MRRSHVLSESAWSNAGFAQFPPPADKVREADEKRRRAEAEEARKQAEAQANAEREARWAAQTAEKVAKAFDEGLNQGRKEAAGRLESLLAGLQKTSAGLKATLLAEAEKLAVELAVELAGAVVRTQVSFDEKVLHAALGDALARTSPENVLRIRVNPDDLAAAQELGAGLRLHEVEISADASIGRGGCAMDTRLGEIDSSIEQRWLAAEQVLRESCGVETPRRGVFETCHRHVSTETFSEAPAQGTAPETTETLAEPPAPAAMSTESNDNEQHDN